MRGDAGWEDVARRVRSQFGAVLPVALIDDVLGEAERDLTGQVVPEAGPELLHRLVVYRLTALTETAVMSWRPTGAPAAHADRLAQGGGSEVVVVGIDGSAEARAALGWALSFGQRVGAMVHACTVWTPSGAREGPPASADEARRLLDAAVGGGLGYLRTDRRLGPRIDCHVAKGDPADVLIEHSRDVALLVLGNHGHGPLTAAVRGSVVWRCSREASCPVVLVPHPDAADTPTGRWPRDV
jgi:nucleotide-binding universal stress UspA family protein